jgi:hypothetical protein
MAACVAVAAPVAAQSQSPPPSGNPFAGLFRGSPKEQPHTLDVTGSAFASSGDTLPGAVPPGNFSDPLAAQGLGIADGFQGAISYGFRRTGPRSGFNFAGNAGAQQFAGGSRDPMRFYNYSASTGLTTKVSTKTTLSFGAASAYAPFFQYAPFLRSTTSEESPVGSDYGFAVHSVMVRSTGASASVENRFSKKSSISAGLGWEQRTSPDSPEADVDARTVRAAFSHNLTRKLGFHVGYGITESRYKLNPDAKPVRSNQISSFAIPL